MQRVFVGDRMVDAVPAGDRGLAYGDGLFETMRAHRGRIHWWDAHWARLRQGAQRLRLALPDEALVHAQAARLLGDADAVLKLLVTRGSGGRGYALPAHPEPGWLVSRHPIPAAAPPGGVVLRWCETRLAIQPALAGLKHCNRLEQVLARGEWADPAIHDGLVLDTEGQVISATSANLFVLRDGRWLTPDVSRSGIAGICRAWVLAHAGAAEARLRVTDVESADAVFVCNAVRGILPVARLGDRTWSPLAQVSALQRRLAAAHPAFATPESP